MRYDDVWFWFTAWIVFTFLSAVFLFIAQEVMIRIDRWMKRRYRDRHAVRRMRRAGRLVVVLCLVLAGSATATAAKRPSPWSHVRIAANVETVAQCTFVADVEASGRYVVTSPSGTAHADRLALKRLRIRTHRAGGNVVLVTWSQAGNSRAFYHGAAYDCDKTE